MADLIEVPAVITHEEVVPTTALRGTSNRTEATIDGMVYPRGSLIFRGFAGASDPRDWRYYGVYRFEPIAEGVEPPPAADWKIMNKKPETKPKRAPKKPETKESEVADGS